MTAFGELCRALGEEIDIRVGRCGYVLLLYGGLEVTEWLLNPYQIVDVDDMWQKEQQE